jgi:biphenyl-2,3-diol 1,2-dioxygenase
VAGVPVELTFLHCNPRHHTLALVPASMPKRLNHFMLQVDSMDDVGLAHDRTGRLDARISDTLAAIRTTTCFPSMRIRRADSRSSSAGAGAPLTKIGQ